MNIELIQQELYNLMVEAANNNEVPVSALIIKDNKILTKAFNKVNSTNNVLDHAEIIAIKEASKKLNNWRLNDCELYISLEPCDMCKEVIKRSRFKKVIYFAKQNSEIKNKEVDYEYINDNNISNYLIDFFKNKR